MPTIWRVAVELYQSRKCQGWSNCKIIYIPKPGLVCLTWPLARIIDWRSENLKRSRLKQQQPHALQRDDIKDWAEVQEMPIHLNHKKCMQTIGYLHNSASDRGDSITEQPTWRDSPVFVKRHPWQLWWEGGYFSSSLFIFWTIISSASRDQHRTDKP